METQEVTEQKPTPSTSVPKVHAAIVAVMAEIGAIEKTKRNEQQNFMFRGVGDAMAACQPLFVKHKLYIRPVKVSADSTKGNIDRDGKPRAGLHSRQTIVYRVTSAEDGSFVDCESTGEAMDFGDKAAGKVMSVSFKFLIFQLFCIPDHNPENDPDGQSPGEPPDDGRRQQTQGRTQSRPAAQAKSEPTDQEKAIKALVGILKAKGISGAAPVLKWLSDKAKRQITKTSQITSEEYPALKKAAEEMPAPGTVGAE